MASGWTGWPPGLLQDDCRGLSKWFASRPGARYQLKHQLEQHMTYELTPWAPSPPPTIGWWETQGPTDALAEAAPAQRRWWDGAQWSLMVIPGSDDVHEVEACRQTRSLAPAARIRWRGLTAPPESGYQYDLNPDGRTALARRAGQPQAKPTRTKLLEL